MAETRADVFSVARIDKVLVILLLLLLLCGEIKLCPGPEDNLVALCKQKGLKLVHQNIHGLLSYIANFEALSNCKERKIDIIGLTETHIVSNDHKDNDGL